MSASKTAGSKVQAENLKVTSVEKPAGKVTGSAGLATPPNRVLEPPKGNGGPPYQSRHAYPSA